MHTKKHNQLSGYAFFVMANTLTFHLSLEFHQYGLRTNLHMPDRQVLIPLSLCR